MTTGFSNGSRRLAKGLGIRHGSSQFPGQSSQRLLAYFNQLLSLAAGVMVSLGLPLILGARVYGEVTVWLSLSYLVVGLFDQGFNLAAIRHTQNRAFHAPLPEAAKLASSIKLVISGFFGCLILGLVPLLERAYRFESGIALFALCGLLIPVLSQLALFDSLLMSNARNGAALAGRLAMLLSMFLFPLVAVWIAPNTLSAASGLFVAFTIGAAILWNALDRPSFALPAIDQVRSYTRDMFALIAISSVFAYLAWGIVTLAGLFLPAADIGNLKISLTAATSIAALVPLPGMLLFARFHALASRSTATELRRELWRSVLVALVFAGVSFIALNQVGPVIIRLVYGSEFELAAILVQITWLVAPLLALELPLLGAVTAQGSLPRVVLPWLLAAGALSMIATIWLSVWQGIIGTAYSAVVGHVMVTAVLLTLAIRATRGCTAPTVDPVEATFSTRKTE